jgi:hypothetical protein
MAKHVVKDKVKPWRQTTFRLQRDAGAEQDVVVHFGRRVKHEVVKLRTSDLPPSDRDGKKITWLFNFEVRDASGKYVKKVKYTVFMPRPKSKRATFIYHDQRGLHSDKTPTYRGSKPARARMVQVDFETGDPGGGLR